MTDVFISYSRKDKEFVRQLHMALEQSNKDVWIDWENIPLTADWLEEIRDGIEAADSFVYVISPDSVHSEVCAEELNYALKNRKRLIPVMRRELMEDYDRAALHPTISSHNWLFFRQEDDFDHAFGLLVAALDVDLNHNRSHTRLLVKAKEWSDRGRDQSLLLRGTDLREAEEWLTLAMGKTPEPTEIHTEYIMTSHNISNSRQRTTLLWVTVALVIAIGMAALAGALWVQASAARRSAEEAQQRAEREAEIAGSLAVASLAQQTNDRILALALAEAASNIIDPPGQVSRALADVVYAPGVRALFDNPQSDANVTDGAFSDGGTLLALGDGDGGLILWNLATNTPAYLRANHAGTPHAGAINRVLFSPSGRQILAASEDGTLSLWNVTTRQQVYTIAAGAPVCDAAFAPDNSYILFGTSSGESCEDTGDEGSGAIFRYDTSKRTLGGAIIPQPPANSDGTIPDSPDTVTAVAIAPDGLRAVFGYASGRMVLWDMAENQVLLDLLPHTARITSLTFSPDGRFILTSSEDETAKKLSASSLRPVNEFIGHTNVVLDAEYSADGAHILTSSEDRTLIYWDAVTGNRLNRLWAHGNFVNSVAFSPDGTRALSTSADGTAMVWDLTPGNVIQVYRGHTDWVRTVDLYEDPLDYTRKIAVSGSDDGTLILWDLLSGEPLLPPLTGHERDVRSVRFVPDGQTVLSASIDGTVRQWTVADGVQINQFTPNGGSGIETMDLNAAGTQALTGAVDGTIALWNVADGEVLRVLEHGGQIQNVRFSPDGSRALSASTSGTAIYWDLSDGSVIHTLTEFEREPLSVSFSPDGTHAVIGSRDAIFSWWDLTSGTRIRPMLGHGSSVRGAAYAPEGDIAMSAAADLNLFLWDLQSGEAIRQFTGHERVVYSVVFTQDGTQALSGSRDKTLILWRVDSDEVLLDWMDTNRYTRPLTQVECDLYRVNCAAQTAAEATPEVTEAAGG